ncbi:MAG: GGDEF domain-containing protein [Pseudomonadota bacterium]
MSSTVSICLLMAAAMVIVAARSISSSAAVSFAIAFASTGIAWAIGLQTPFQDGLAGINLLSINFFGAIGMAAMWSGFWLRSGREVNWLFIGALTGLWLAPVAAVYLFDLHPGAYMPFAVTSIAIGVVSSTWVLQQRRGGRNAGDLALNAWVLLGLPVTAFGFWIGWRNSYENPVAAFGFYLSFLPTILTGVGLFALLSFTLDAIEDSKALARTDGLTGLLNRRAFDDELVIAVARAERYQRELSLILLDIDNFKTLNDTYGHPAGDAVLRAIARVLLEKSRRIDVVARIGGEEFAVILADTPASAALRLAERLRQAVSNASSESIGFTASFGVANLQDIAGDPEELLREADKALYSAKENGRNRVRYADQVDREPKELLGLVR